MLTLHAGTSNYNLMCNIAANLKTSDKYQLVYVLCCSCNILVNALEAHVYTRPYVSCQFAAMLQALKYMLTYGCNLPGLCNMSM